MVGMKTEPTIGREEDDDEDVEMDMTEMMNVFTGVSSPFFQ